MRVTSVKNLSTKAIDRVIGRLITDTRKKNKISENQLAEGLGVTLRQMQKYENGENAILISRLLLMSEIMNVPSVEIMKQLQKRLRIIGG